METSLSGIACLLVIRQGGYGWVKGSSTEFTFPVSFSVILGASCIAISSAEVNGGSSGHWLKAMGKSKIVCNPNFTAGASMVWLAIGY